MEENIEEKDMTPILVEDLGMEYVGGNKNKYRYGIFKCKYCGKEFKTSFSSIDKGSTKSCGCLQHGQSYNRFYRTWKGMIDRCYNKTNDSYLNYGERGIIVCKDWFDIHTFIKWADETYIEDNTLDRIDNNKGYSPDNCRWADKTLQVLNRRKFKNNTSGYIGVSWDKRDNLWKVQIRVNKKRIHLCCSKDKMKAVRARDMYIIENNLPHKLAFPKETYDKD